MKNFKFTGDVFLKLLSLLIFLVFLFFAILSTIKEVSLPKDTFLKIVKQNCEYTIQNSTKPLDFASNSPNAFKSEEEFLKSKANCYFVSTENRNFSKWTQQLFKRAKLNHSQYLYVGKKGVLIFAGKKDFSKPATTLFDCLRHRKCDFSSFKNQKFSLTLSLVKNNGKYLTNITYKNMLMAHIAKDAKRFFRETTAIKKENFKDLKFQIAFYEKRAYTDFKDEKKIKSLMKFGIDSLFLASRGAKILLLPWDFKVNPVRYISWKGREYGLKQQEYKEKEAELYFIRTNLFREKDNKIEKFTGFDFFNNKISNKLAIKYLLRFLENNVKKEGAFFEEKNIVSGESLKNTTKLFYQINTLQSIEFLLATTNLAVGEYKKMLDLEKNLAAFLLENQSKMTQTEKLFLYNVVFQFKKLQPRFKEFTKTINEKLNSFFENKIVVSKNHKGILFLALLNFAKTNKKQQNKIVEFINNSIQTKKHFSFVEKLYMLPVFYDQNIKKPINFEVNFRKELQNKLDKRNFAELTGGLKPDLNHSPNTLATSLTAQFMSFVIDKINDSQLIEIYDNFSYFLKRNIVKDGTYPAPKNSLIKKTVLGGVRYKEGSKKEFLFSTTNSLFYFLKTTLNKKQ